MEETLFGMRLLPAVACSALLGVLPLLGADSAYKPASPEPTPEETQILELLNRFRANPRAELEWIAPKGGTPRQSWGGVDWEMFRKEMSALKAAPPLVFNLQLLDAARKHSHYMILNGMTHVEEAGKPGFEGASFSDRCKKAGYLGAAGAENCFRDSSGPEGSHVGFIVDSGEGPGGMQPRRGHRANMMGGFREIGCSGVPHDGRLCVTHDFGNRGAARMAGGVAYCDKNGNSFYDLGEGLGNVRISADDGTGTVTWRSGAYELDLKTSNKVVLKAEFSGLSFTKTFEAGKDNLKFDWVLTQEQLDEKADQILAQVEKVNKETQASAYTNALLSLYLGTKGLAVSAERRAKIDELTKDVRTDVEAHQKAVLDALEQYDPMKFPRILGEHRKSYGTGPLANWFKEAELTATQKGQVIIFEKQSEGMKPQQSVKKPFVQQLEAIAKQMQEPLFRAQMESLVARAKAVGP
jgi:hypothetical protein